MIRKFTALSILIAICTNMCEGTPHNPFKAADCDGLAGAPNKDHLVLGKQVENKHTVNL